MDQGFAETHDPKFHALLAFLARIPAIETNTPVHGGFGSGLFENGCWWVKLTIRIEHQLAWSTVQELGYVLNYLSLDEPLPTVFKPVSPPPYLNGGPEFLSWVIESKLPDFTPDLAAKWLEGRMPQPVEDPAQWPINQTEPEES
jgi:hypothetical protein